MNSKAKRQLQLALVCFAVSALSYFWAFSSAERQPVIAAILFFVFGAGFFILVFLGLRNVTRT